MILTPCQTINYWEKNCQPCSNFANFEAPPRKTIGTFLKTDNIIL